MSVLGHTKQLLLVIFLLQLQELELLFGHTGKKDKHTDVEVEIST